MYFESTIKGGLPVLVEFVVYKADPSVGDFNDGIEELIVKWKSGHEIKFEIPKEDLNRLYDEAYEYINEKKDFIKCVRKYGYEKCFDVY